MKKFKHVLFIIVAFSISVTSCSDDDDDDDNHDFHLERVNVISAELPESLNFGTIYDLDVTIALPNSCYFFYDQFEYIQEESTRIIYPIAHVDDGNDCNSEITETTFTIPVRISQYEPYIFKFYQGVDADGEEKFLIIEVPVNGKDENTENSGVKTSDIVSKYQ
ncbi:MAG: hypothetical protein COB81_07600 [Flavobacteriaceae bacterium]|nr:MAG: hypothetical protein COB81_07600 [Flavobacteriaceae bacterium]